MAIGDLFIPVLPIDLTGDLDSASGAAGAALVSARWATTAAILRNALSASEDGAAAQLISQGYGPLRKNETAPRRSRAN